MRDYIILNNNDSRQLQGLIISTLPPISMPKQRVILEEIDGRDGDIITNLGYSAYDKEFEIGLSFNYNFDDIIKYFSDNKKGKAIFSNESDKYYKYEIYEQIDFNKLIRFKTATVKMHVQPFKYSSEDNFKIFKITDETSISVRNVGNIYSKPTIRIKGSGNIGLSLNGFQVFQIELGELESITIDTTQMEAYNETNLLNRLVIGNYDNFKFSVGKNIITWNGTISQIEIENYSRWI